MKQSNKMHISLSINKDIHRDYLRGMFEQGKTGNLILTKEQDFGKALISMIRYSKYPLKEPEDRNNVKFDVTPELLAQEGDKPEERIAIRFELPNVKSLANAANYYLYILKDDEEKLNDMLDVMFNLDLFTYFIEGLQLGFMRKDIVEAFIINKKIVKLIGDNETLKKREYRKELQNKKKYTDMLLKKTYYRHKLIENAIKRRNDLRDN